MKCGRERTTGRGRAEKEEGEKCNVGPFVSSSTCRGPNSFMVYVTLYGPSQTWAFLSHTHPSDHHGGHDSIYFCLTLDAFIF